MSDPFEPKPPAASLAGQPAAWTGPGLPRLPMREPASPTDFVPTRPLPGATGLEACLLARADEPPFWELHFLIWIGGNLLKSPESDEGIQDDPSPFSWSGLVWIWFGLEELA